MPTAAADIIVRKLELYKWAALKNKNISTTSTTTYIDYCDGSIVTVETPEGYSWDISLFRINLSYSLENHSSNHILRMDFTNGQNDHQMHPAFMTNSSGKKVYLFVGSEHGYFENDEKLKIYNEYLYNVSLGSGYAFVPYSVIITTENEYPTFGEFRSLSYAQWRSHFDDAVGNAVNGEFDAFLKYDPWVLCYELDLADRKDILSYILNEESWSWWDFDGFNEEETVVELFAFVTEEDSIALYDWVFAGNGWKFSKFHDLLSGDYLQQWTILLLKAFYLKKSNSNEPLFPENFFTNPDWEKIVPIGGETISHNYLGVTFASYSTENNHIEFEVRLNILDGFNRRIIVKDWPYSSNKVFKYDDFVVLVPVIDAIDYGFVKLKFYPVPAFAIWPIHSMITETDSWIDVVSFFMDLASIAFPFYKLVSSSSMAAMKLLGLFYEVTSFIISELENYINNSEEGKIFLACFNFVNTFFDLKDGTIAVKNIYNVYRKYKKLCLYDFDFLSASWTAYTQTQSYTSEITHNTKMKELANLMSDFQTNLTKIRSSIND